MGIELWDSITGGFIVNQSLWCFCLTHANVTKDMMETGSNFATTHVVDMYKLM
jgi:hypothetical protein